MRFVPTRVSSLLAVCAFALTAALAASAHGAEAKDNPAYQAWTKFKPGSSASLTGNMELTGGQKVVMELTNKLVSVTPDKATVEHASTMTVMGQERKNPTSSSDIPAKDTKEAMKDLGEEEIEAAGKKFKCKVLEGNGDAVGQSKATAKLWVNADVPGGVVKMVVTMPRGTMTYVLKSFEVK